MQPEEYVVRDLARLRIEYQAHRGRGWSGPIDNADEYIAALEAESAGWKRSHKVWCDDLANIAKMKARAEQAEAELESLAAKYKWQLKTAIGDDGEDDDQRRQQWVDRELADLDLRWDRRGAK